MKILLLSPSMYMSARFGGMIYAPRELSIDLANGLVAAGNEVIFATAPDVKTDATVFPGDASYLDLMASSDAMDPHGANATLHSMIKRDYEVDLLSRAFEEAKNQNVDIVHAYAVTMAHYFQSSSGKPAVYTIHDPLPKQGTLGWTVFKKFANHGYISISNSQRRDDSVGMTFVDTVYHGINLSRYRFEKEPADYLLFMGRLVPEKGLHNAIAAAISTNMRLEIGTQFGGHQGDPYFETKIRPFLTNPFISEPGMVNDVDKVRLYGGAKALLFPIEWEEPFGMVLIESMACGAPVIAYNRGSVPEIVKDGVTGFIIDPDDSERSGKGTWVIKKQGVDGIIEAIGRINEISRDACRKHIEESFSVQKMVQNYLSAYRKAIQ